MPLNKTALENSLKQAFAGPTEKGNVDTVAEALATSIDAYVRTAQVTGTITGTSPSGPVTGTITTGSLQ